MMVRKRASRLFRRREGPLRRRGKAQEKDVMRAIYLLYMQFKLVSKFNPTGDQPQAIEKLVAAIESGAKHQVLLGVTGSGKTFTMANVIEKTQRPALVISPN